ncbi:UPF0171-domain-containing protein [Coleophoma crateriformis]|uniref:Nitrogen permease regulator 3 n=1 Tax=Coleophoma crateriformis TaxID=565419 RepID=A0A3D8RD48_9HELO|nr:UPF0171-domain-containing protein [Coleophoma crateriformis]
MVNRDPSLAVSASGRLGPPPLGGTSSTPAAHQQDGPRRLLPTSKLKLWTESRSHPSPNASSSAHPPAKTRSALQMSEHPILSVDTGLVGVCLVIRSRDGPRFVFHHPPRPIIDTVHHQHTQGTEIDQNEVEDGGDGGGDDSGNGNGERADEDTSDSELGDDAGYQKHGKTVARLDNPKASKRRSDHVGPLDSDDHYDGLEGEQVVPWETVFDLPTKDLESILTPQRSFHKKRFELHLDPLYFVSYPVHLREDGTWKKQRKSKKDKQAKNQPLEDNRDEDDIDPLDPGPQQDLEKSVLLKPLSDDDDDHGGMTMFNAVFVLSIPEDGTDEHTFQRIHEVYDNVVKDFNKALKHAQAQCDYVWKESELIMSMKEKAREERRPMSWLWNEIMARSSLAAAIRDVSDAIMRSKIATVHLATNPPVDMSLQIPVPFYLSQLPSIIQSGQRNKGMPGLLVTTANPLLDDDGNIDHAHLNKHFALLLLDDKDKIISELQSDNTELSAPLIEYIKLSPPTQSFLQVAQANSISLNDVKTLAQHLIYWRRAIPIPPLHARDTFIVSPNCDSRKLPNASLAWNKAFPLAPQLPTFLATLSAAPRHYKSFFPSKDHRGQYMDMLAWLIRGGWVTQLRTFCWIMVWPEIIYEVEYERMSNQVNASKEPPESSNSGSNGGNNNSSRRPYIASTSSSTDESGSEKDSKPPLASSNLPLTSEQIAESARLERIALKAEAENLAFAQAFAARPKPEATAHPSLNNAAHLANIAPHIIKDPHRIDEKDSLYMDAIGARIEDEKARKNWARFCRYFNGEDALESIALLEGMKRKEAWGIIAYYQEHLLISRHW